MSEAEVEKFPRLHSAGLRGAKAQAKKELTAAAGVDEPLQDEPCPELTREMRQAHKRKLAALRALKDEP